MVDQGEKAKTQAMAGAVKATPTVKTTAPAVTANTIVAEKQTGDKKPMVIGKEALENMIAKDMGLRAMAKELGTQPHVIRKALKDNGLKTKSMREGTGRVSLLTSSEIITAIKNGAGTYETVAEKTGISQVVVKTVVRKLKREGTVVDAFVIAKADAPATV